MCNFMLKIVLQFHGPLRNAALHSGMESPYIKISRAELADLLKEARKIAVMDKDTDLTHSGDAYARALGRCNGIAKGMAVVIESILGTQ